MRFSSGDPEPINDHETLAQAEIDLLCEAIDMFLDTLHLHASIIHRVSDPSTDTSSHDDFFLTNVKAFDELDVCEQLALIQSIGQTLVTERTLATSVSALHDAALAVLIEFIRGNVEAELDMIEYEDDDDEFESWRQRVRDVALAQFSEPDFEHGIGLPDVSDTDFENWSPLIDLIAERWLADRDFELAELLMDAAPQQSTPVKEQLGIHEDYFVGTINEPSPDDFDDCLNEIRQLIRRKPR